ncbi:hypothetical protein Bbelb_098410 [Branchiostoma belcheri]|nr:hypothetical protein Bbelb_098410 [Branchiostoma belcheri]
MPSTFRTIDRAFRIELVKSTDHSIAGITTLRRNTPALQAHGTAAAGYITLDNLDPHWSVSSVGLNNCCLAPDLYWLQGSGSREKVNNNHSFSTRDRAINLQPAKGSGSREKVNNHHSFSTRDRAINLQPAKGSGSREKVNNHHGFSTRDRAINPQPAKATGRGVMHGGGRSGYGLDVCATCTAPVPAREESFAPRGPSVFRSVLLWDGRRAPSCLRRAGNSEMSGVRIVPGITTTSFLFSRKC